MPPSPSSPGPEVIGDYELLDKIAEGGAGIVYRGRHRHTGQVVAVKVLPQELARAQVLLRRFEQEFRTASKLDHPNIVRALDFDDRHSTPFLVLEYVAGESLGAKLEREGRMEEGRAIDLIVQVCKGLHHAHAKGIIHRDVKPDNVLVTPSGDVKLTDLGLVKETLGDQNLTRTGRGLGTPHFMAPEQFRDAKHADVRCDVYGLGATLYMMVTGELPFKSSGPFDAWTRKIRNDLPPPRTLAPDLSPRTDEVIRQAMAPEPGNRPASCLDFAIALGASPFAAPLSATVLRDAAFYLVYTNREGQPSAVKQPCSTIRRWLETGELANATDVKGSRTSEGPYLPLDRFPEFAGLPIPAARASRTVLPVPTLRAQALDEEADGSSGATWVLVVAFVAMVGGMIGGWVLFRG